MKQRSRKLACLCIATALIAAANTKPVKADERNKQEETVTESHALHIGAAAFAMESAQIGVEEFQKEEKQEKPQPDEPEALPELAVAQVDSYINVRSQPGLDGEIVGKLYNDSVGEIVKEEGEWLQISSGTVQGYIKAEYALRGEEGAAKAEEVGERRAKVEAVTLRLREEATTESETLGLLPQAEELLVEEEAEGWIKVTTQEQEGGYVSADHVEVYTIHPVAESKEEEEARLAAMEAENAQNIDRQETQAQTAVEELKQQNLESFGDGETIVQKEEKKAVHRTEQKEEVKAPSGGIGTQIADYALQFVGNPYVYGGTSLTNGADCSGFVMSVYAHFGIGLPRTSGEQGQCGTNVGGIENALPGDLVSYSGHIGIYIGNGQIVHASTEKTGIKISNASYRPILSVRRIV